MAARDDAEQDLSFGGWRDWLLVLVGGAITIGALVAAAIVGVGSRGGPLWLSLPVAVGVVALAVVAASVWHRLRR